MIIPEAGRERLQAGIDRARMEKKRVEHARRRSAWTAVAAAAVVMIALPNTNIQIAHAMENIPLREKVFPQERWQSVLPLWRAQLQKVWKESVSDRRLR